MQNKFLLMPNASLVALMASDGAQVKKGSRRWSAWTEQARLLRQTWGHQLSAATGLNIVGADDGQWTLRCNQDQFERLAQRLELTATQCEALVAGHRPDGLSDKTDIPSVGEAVAKEVENEYRLALELRGVAGWLRSLPPGSYSGSPQSNATRQSVIKELGRFWSWVGSMRGRHRLERRPEADPRALRIKVLRLAAPVKVVDVAVLTAKELTRVPLEVIDALQRVAQYITLVGRGEAGDTELRQAHDFFGLLGLELVKKSGLRRRRNLAPQAPLACLALKGNMAKGWMKSISAELIMPPSCEILNRPEELLVAHRLFAQGVSRLFEASGLIINLECLEVNGPNQKSTGLVEKTADHVETQLVLAEARAGGLKTDAYVAPIMDNLWLRRHYCPSYDLIDRKRMSKADLDFWEPTEYHIEWAKKVKHSFLFHQARLTPQEQVGLKPQSRSLVVNEGCENLRLASLLNGSGAGWLRHYMVHRASDSMKSVLSGTMDGRAPVPRTVWKELRLAIWNAKVWAAWQLFNCGHKWMGLSPDYRRRLRTEIHRLFKRELDALTTSDDETYCQYFEQWWNSFDPFFDAKVTRDLNGTSFTPDIHIGQVPYSCALFVQPTGPIPWVFKSERARQCRELDIQKAVFRLICAGANAGRRSLICGLATRENRGVLPNVLTPVLPVDGPKPVDYLESLETSRGYHLSYLFEIPKRQNAKLEISNLSKVIAKTSSLEFFDASLVGMEKNVTVEGLRQQWAWASKYPQMVTFGNWTPAMEVTILRLGWRWHPQPETQPSRPEDISELLEPVEHPISELLQ